MNTVKDNPKTLKGEVLGNPITETLSELLKKYTDANDHANVATMTTVGLSTVRQLVYRKNSLTADNMVAMVQLGRIALENARLTAINAEGDVDNLNQILPI